MHEKPNPLYPPFTRGACDYLDRHLHRRAFFNVIRGWRLIQRE